MRMKFTKEEMRKMAFSEEEVEELRKAMSQVVKNVTGGRGG